MLVMVRKAVEDMPSILNTTCICKCRYKVASKNWMSFQTTSEHVSAEWNEPPLRYLAYLLAHKEAT
jgi:hypothetical protein